MYNVMDYECERCDSPATERHHKDDDVTNNDPSNIEFLCKSCHTTESLKRRWADPKYRRQQIKANRRTAMIRIARSGSIRFDRV
jgi:hypothetical protein